MLTGVVPCYGNDLVGVLWSVRSGTDPSRFRNRNSVRRHFAPVRDECKKKCSAFPRVGSAGSSVWLTPWRGGRPCFVAARSKDTGFLGVPSISILNPGILLSTKTTQYLGATAGFGKERWLKRMGNQPRPLFDPCHVPDASSLVSGSIPRG